MVDPGLIGATRQDSQILLLLASFLVQRGIFFCGKYNGIMKNNIFHVAFKCYSVRFIRFYLDKPRKSKKRIEAARVAEPRGTKDKVTRPNSQSAAQECQQGTDAAQHAITGDRGCCARAFNRCLPLSIICLPSFNIFINAMRFNAFMKGFL